MMETIPTLLRIVGGIVAIVIIIAGRRNKDFAKVSVSEVDHLGTKKSNHKVIIAITVLGGLILSVIILAPDVFTPILRWTREFLDNLPSMGARGPILLVGGYLLIVLVIRTMWKFLGPESFRRHQAALKVKMGKGWRNSLAGSVGFFFFGAAHFLEGFENERDWGMAAVWALLGLFTLWAAFKGRGWSLEGEKAM
jgi:hypothetical protein